MPLHCETVHFAAAKKEMVGQKNNKGSRPNSDCNMSWNKIYWLQQEVNG